MSKVLIVGTVCAVFLYALVGIFGYATFVYNPSALDSGNILEAPYGNNIPIIIVRNETIDPQFRATLHYSLQS